MIIILEERAVVGQGYVSCFDREGVSAVAFGQAEFGDWLDAADAEDVRAIEAVLVGAGRQRLQLPRRLRARLGAAIIGLSDERSLGETLELFEAGVDDVVTKPVHVREILARIAVIRRRQRREPEVSEVAGIRVGCDGSDPIVGGAVLPLPRRERRILEYLVANRNVRVTKAQIFSRVYGLFNDEIDETVIESHISRLRKRLRERLGRDPIESQRFLGYRIVEAEEVVTPAYADASPVQVARGSLALCAAG
jgi:DNA-binding response OmpR family regulator